MRIPVLPLHKYPWLVRWILLAQKWKYGEALVPSMVWGRSPKLMYGLQAFYRALDRKKSPLEPALRALVSVRVSQLNSCRFCLDIGAALLKKRGVPEEKLLSVGSYLTDPAFSARERVALRYADAITISGAGVDDSLFLELRNQFGEVEIVELTALIAFQNMSSKFNAALDIPAQGFCLPARNEP